VESRLSGWKDDDDGEEEKEKTQTLQITAADFIIAKVKASTNKVVEPEVEAIIRSKEDAMKRRLEAHVVLTKIPNPLAESTVRDFIRGTAAGKLRGEPGKDAIGIVVDPGMMGEPVTAPHIRTCPINQAAIKAHGA
jgi:hypothetical protein